MRRKFLSLTASLFFSLTLAAQIGIAQNAPAPSQSPASVPAPRDVLGFTPGDDRRLASWASVVDYFQRLDRASDRVMFEELGRSTLDRPFVMATISAPENLRRLDEFRDIQRQLADPRPLGRDNAERDRRAASLIQRGKTIVLITCGIHSTEVGSYLSSMLIAHRLASSNDPEVRRILENTIILLVPSLNPDGVDIVKDWYDRTLNTPYEGTSPPTLYHHYVGHDNNRDWYAFTQRETQITVDRIHNVWHPQIVHDIHQQGVTGARLFLPPYMQPVEPNVPREIIEGYTELGRFMAGEMRREGMRGITTDSTYDAWTPARAYSHYHGGVRILSETASARLASPVTLRFEDLRTDPSDGFDPRRESANFPEVWRGGEWHLRDITNYMTTAAFHLMGHAAGNRERWLRRFYEIGREAVRERRPGELFGFVISFPPSRGWDTLNRYEFLVSALRRGGVETVDTEQGTLVRLDQPYGGFAKALLELQRYPNLRDSSGNPQPPYDVTAHTLSLLAGNNVRSVHTPFEARPRPFFHLGGLIGCDRGIGHTAIYESYIPSMDAGWTRWLWSDYRSERCITISTLRDNGAREGNLWARYDTIILPDQSSRAILEGHRAGTMPEEFTGGLGAEGVRALREFVESGGTLICLNRASNFAIEQLNLPVRDITQGVNRTQFYVPGSILRTELDMSHPIAAGMPQQSIAWVENSPVFEATNEAGDRVRVVARYPASGDLLLSGWLLGGERIRGKAALVEVQMGRGRVVLFGFRPQYRGQSLATYPLLFNSIARRER